MAALGKKLNRKQNFSVIKKINHNQKAKTKNLKLTYCKNELKYNLFKLLKL